MEALPGAHELVVELHRLGLVTVIAASSPADEVDRLVELLRVADVLDARTTIDDVDRSKPDPEIFVTAMRTGDLQPSASIAIGDSRWDVEAATAAGIDCIALETGGTSRPELLEAGAVAVYRDPQHLLDELASSPVARLLRENHD